MTDAAGRDESEAGTVPEAAAGEAHNLAEGPGAAGADTHAADTHDSGTSSHDTPERATPGQRTPARPKRRLALGDPVARVATEDRPESWGEHGDSDSDRLAFYRAQRPPHHGG